MDSLDFMPQVATRRQRIEKIRQLAIERKLTSQETIDQLIAESYPNVSPGTRRDYRNIVLILLKNGGQTDDIGPKTDRRESGTS